MNRLKLNIISLLTLIVLSSLLIFSIKTVNSQSVINNLPVINRYARVGVDALPIVAPDGFILLAEETRPQYL